MNCHSNAQSDPSLGELEAGQSGAGPSFEPIWCWTNSPVRRRLTRDSRVSVVSLEIPGIVVSLEISVFRIFSRKKSGKIVKIGFLDSQDQNGILKLLVFFRNLYVWPVFPI